RRSRAGGERTKAQRRKTATRKSRTAPKAVRPHPGPAAPRDALRLVLETALDAVVVMKSDGVVADWNDRAAGVFGWSRDAAGGRPDNGRPHHPRAIPRSTPKRTSTISQNRYRERFRHTH